jgi:tripartite-type tricarboxylate transporter receptor subunit TctC
VKVAGVKFDARKFSWVGSTGVEPTILTLRSDLPYKTIEDLRKEKKEVFLGSVGKASTDYQFPILLKEFVGINFNFVIYPGGADINLAIERKELDGRVGSYSSLKPFIERGLLRPFVRCRVSVQGIESLPVDEDLTNDIKGKRLMSMLAAPARLGRPYIAPPGVPNEIMNILWDAFAKVVKDPELKEDAKKNRFEVEYVSADEIQRILNELFNQPPDIIEEFRKYIKF